MHAEQAGVGSASRLESPGETGGTGAKPSGWTGSVLVLGGYAACAVVVEVFFAGAKEQLLSAVGLRGMGFFLWLFGALVIGLELFRNRLQAMTDETEAVARAVFRGDRGRVAQENLFGVYLDERHHAPFLPGAGSAGELTKLLERDPGLVHQVLSLRVARIEDRLSLYETRGKDIAAQLGLLGTVTGLVRALQSMAENAKDVSLVGGKALAALGGAQLGTAFSTTMAACYIVILVLILSGLLRMRTVRAARGIRQLGRALSLASARAGQDEENGDQGEEEIP